MKHAAFVMALGMICLPCLAQKDSQYVACNKSAKTQSQLNDCASAEAKRVDAKRNEAYAKLLSKVSQDQVAVTKVKAAEEAWISYRNAYIDAAYPAKDRTTAYGSAVTVEIDLLIAEVTQDHIKALTRLSHQ
jgi:uncharacterized protein YecT (DUF1311 family)